MLLLDLTLNIYSPVNITASDQKNANGVIWKPIDGIRGPKNDDVWASLGSANSWWRMEFPRKSAISRVTIYPRFLDSTKRASMNGFAVYIGDFAVGNGSSNAICGDPWTKSQINVITFNCTGNTFGKYLYVAAASRPKATLFLSEISVYGCEGD